jgi:sporulation protein YlmC with PRC-barrel domain
MDIHIDADVVCEDGHCGKSQYVVIDPTSKEVTHLVIGQREAPPLRLVPVGEILETDCNQIRLRGTREQLASMAPFTQSEYDPGSGMYVGYEQGQYWLVPHNAPIMLVVKSEAERLPTGELAVHKGASVVATDGKVGNVDELVTDPQTNRITHLVLREGHMWGRRDVCIPVSEIDQLDENAVYLKLDRRSIEALPRVPA